MVSVVSVMPGIRPGCWRGGAVELVVFLAGHAGNLHGWYGVHVARGQNGGGSGSGSLGGVLHTRNGNRVAVVRLAVAEPFGERIAGDLQLRYAMILVSGDRGESRLREREGFEVLRAGIRAGTRRGRCHHHVTPRLVPMHRIQDYLKREQTNDRSITHTLCN